MERVCHNCKLCEDIHLNWQAGQKEHERDKSPIGAYKGATETHSSGRRNLHGNYLLCTSQIWHLMKSYKKKVVKESHEKTVWNVNIWLDVTKI